MTDCPVPKKFYDKRCVKCYECKNIQHFRRNGKVCKVCNKCSPNNNLVKCIRCGKEKEYHKFQRDSKVYKSCNDCLIGSIKEIDDNFRIVFNTMTSVIRGSKNIESNKLSFD